MSFKIKELLEATHVAGAGVTKKLKLGDTVKSGIAGIELLGPNHEHGMAINKGVVDSTDGKLKITQYNLDDNEKSEIHLSHEEAKALYQHLHNKFGAK
jgi:hypothetical protein